MALTWLASFDKRNIEPEWYLSKKQPKKPEEYLSEFRSRVKKKSIWWPYKKMKAWVNICIQFLGETFRKLSLKQHEKHLKRFK